MDGAFPGRPQSFWHQRRHQWTPAALDEGEWRRTVEQGAEHIMAKWIAAEEARDVSVISRVGNFCFLRLFTSVFIDTAPPSACTARFGVSWQQCLTQ